MYFNPRSREGSDGLQTVAFAVRRRISIHAPAKGATKPLRKKAEEVEISIHAPAKGATSVDAISSG